MKLDESSVIEKLGSGDSSDVFLVDLQGKRYALKVLHGFLAEDIVVKQRFVGEGQLLSGIRHPNIVRVASVEEYQGRPAFVMEYLPGGTAAKQRMDTDGALAVVEGVASALAEIHRHGIVHRDVRPEHILFDSHGVPKLTDFGAASIRDLMGLTRSTVFTNQPHYMDPYTWGRASRSPIQDIYGLGAVVYELLLGVPPNDQLPVRGWLTRSDAIDRLAEVTTPAAAELIAAMIDAPERRPRSAQEVLSWLSLNQATGGRDLTECLYCGSAMPAESPLCLECQREPLQVKLNPVGRFIALRKISEDQQILSPFLRKLRRLAAEPDPQFHLLIGDVRLYSRSEQKSGTRLPVRIADGVAEESVEPLITLLTAGSFDKIRITAHEASRTWGGFKRGPLITLRSGTVRPRVSTSAVVSLIKGERGPAGAQGSSTSQQTEETRVTKECRYALAIAASRLAEGDEEEWGIAESRLHEVWRTLATALDQIATTRRYLSSLDLPRAYAELELADEGDGSLRIAAPVGETTGRIAALFQDYAQTERTLARISLGVSEACRELETISPETAAEAFRSIEQWLADASTR